MIHFGFFRSGTLESAHSVPGSGPPAQCIFLILVLMIDLYAPSMPMILWKIEHG